MSDHDGRELVITIVWNAHPEMHCKTGRAKHSANWPFETTSPEVATSMN